jgi:hypothetical protein
VGYWIGTGDNLRAGDDMGAGDDIEVGDDEGVSRDVDVNSPVNEDGEAGIDSIAMMYYRLWRELTVLV